jgi:hypothetical protein
MPSSVGGASATITVCRPVSAPVQVLKGQLSLNRTCWTGIGVSPDGSMQNATVFLIAQLNQTTSTASVGLYSVANAPYGHAPPVVSRGAVCCDTLSVSEACVCRCVDRWGGVGVAQLRADQTEVWGTAITYSAG